MTRNPYTLGELLRQRFATPPPKGMRSRGAAGPDPGFDAPKSDDDKIVRQQDYIENAQSAERGELVPYCRCTDLVGYCCPRDCADCQHKEAKRDREFYGLVPR